MTTTQQEAGPQQESAGRPAAAPTDSRDGRVIWWEIQVPELEVAKAFYAAVFGWTYSAFGEGFVICHGPDGAMIGGLEQIDGEPAGRHVRVYVQTSDLEATLARVESAGGTVVQQRGVISEEYGWYALVTDPSGLTIGLCTDRSASPPT